MQVQSLPPKPPFRRVCKKLGLPSHLYAGMAGGAVQNPARALAQLLATLWAPNGSVAVKGFYDK